MRRTCRGISLGIFLNISIGIVFLVAAITVVILVNYNMRQQGLREAESKARIILDRNLATHTVFTEIMRPRIFEWTEPFRTKEYFDPAWMSSTFAIRRIEKYFKSLGPSGYFFKNAAVNARSPENEADEYERAFLEKLNADKKLEAESTVRKIDGKPYLAILRKGEVLEASCLRCHSNPKDAPKGLTDYYGSERGFNHKAGDVISTVSLRIPFSETYKAANIFSWKLSGLLVIALACLFTIQYWFYRRYLLKPLHVIQGTATQITAQEEHLGDQIPQPFGRELGQLATALSDMSAKLRRDKDNLEELVQQRTAELNLASEQFRQQRNFAESLVETAPAIVLVLDPRGRIIRFNAYMEEICGYRLEEVQGKDWLATFVAERDQDRVRQLFLKAISGIKTKANINPIVTKNGHEREVEWYDKTLKDAAGQTIGLLCIGQDITERRRMEGVLKESEGKFKAIFDHASGGIFLLDLECRKFVMGNEKCLKMLGFMQEEFSNLDISELHPPEDLPFIFEQIGKFAGGDEGARRDIRFRRKDGSIFFTDLSPALITLGEKKCLLVDFRDITERKQAEERIQASLQEKEVLLKEIHHRVKNNMQVISSLLNMQSRHIKDEEGRRIFKDSQDRVQAMAMIHEKFFQSRDFSRIDFGAYIRDLVSSLRQSYGLRSERVKLAVEGKDIFLEISTAIPCALIINELVSNSMKYAFPGDRDGEIFVDIRAEGEQVRLGVRDNGKGFPESLDFRKTESLGLQLVRMLVDQVKGTIELHQDGGTEFRIAFPAGHSK